MSSVGLGSRTSRAFTWGCASKSSTLLTGAAVTRSAAKRSSQWARSRVPSTASSCSTISCCRSMRSVLVAYSGSVDQSSLPMAMHMRCHMRSEEHTSELQSRFDLVCRLLLEKKKTKQQRKTHTHNAQETTEH